MKVPSVLFVPFVLSAALLTARAGEEIVRGDDAFQFIYRVKLPPITGERHVWLPLAKTGLWQSVTVDSISSPVEPRKIQDRSYGNEILVLDIGPAETGKTTEFAFRRTKKK